MAPPPPSPQLFLLAALVGFLRPSEVVAGLAEEAGARCPEDPWPLPPQVSPRVTYTRMIPGVAEDVSFLYHPCAHPWLKIQLALLAHVCVAQPSLAPDPSLTQARPLVLAAWGVALEMARVEPAWAAHWLKRRRWRKQRKKALFRLSGSTPLVQTPGRGRLNWRGCVQAPALAFALQNWWPLGTELAPSVPRQSSPGGAKRRELRAALALQPTPSVPRHSSASPQNWEVKKPTLDTLGEEGNASSVPIVPLLPGGFEGNASSKTEAQAPNGQGSPGGCACPSKVSSAPRAAVPPRAPRGPTPRTEEAAWAATALTFLLVLLTLATLCTRLHRNFRRGESIYWGSMEDSQDTVAAVLKRRLLIPQRRVKRSRRRPLLPPTPDSGPDGDSSD
ncbi:PREDICTED: tumor protein p53-inducible protein 13 [Chrysochloris asiatica]|uniref:Tumor protein p53-inducible protein 13 n=1 Tax=Chrysochloris asiatica TaxID=185453 RepID=A0A9B0WXZ6_CHRAS|nr:PREDICTED: tumor protein p53-inducible protein 13 [Chrysochloris asiatica]